MKLTTDLSEQIGTLAADAGACEFKIISSEDVVFTETVRLLCEQECAEYDLHSYSLPPYVGTYQECYDKCHRYSHALLVSTIHPANDISSIEEWMNAGIEMNLILKGLSEQISALSLDVLPLGMRCRRCNQCACPNEPCRNPDSLLPATEGYGIHIMNTMENHGITGYYDGYTIVCFGIIFIS